MIAKGSDYAHFGSTSTRRGSAPHVFLDPSLPSRAGKAMAWSGWRVCERVWIRWPWCTLDHAPPFAATSHPLSPRTCVNPKRPTMELEVWGVLTVLTYPFFSEVSQSSFLTRYSVVLFSMAVPVGGRIDWDLNPCLWLHCELGLDPSFKWGSSFRQVTSISISNYWSEVLT